MAPTDPAPLYRQVGGREGEGVDLPGAPSECNGRRGANKGSLRIVQSPLPIANQAGYNQAGADEAGVARSSMGTTPGKTPNAGTTPAAGVTPGAIVAVENTPLDGALLSAGRTSAVGAAGTPASGILSPAASLVDAASMDATLPALGEHLLLRVVDDKPAACRAALNALEGWAKASRTPLTSAIINTIRLRCKDTSPAIRKQAAKALNGLLTQDPSSTSIRSAWLQGVLPLLRDSELSVSEAALDSLHELILQPLARCSETPSRGFGTVSWQLLQRLTPESEPLLQHGVAALSRQKRLPPRSRRRRRPCSRPTRLQTRSHSSGRLRLLRPPARTLSPAPPCGRSSSSSPSSRRWRTRPRRRSSIRTSSLRAGMPRASSSPPTLMRRRLARRRMKRPSLSGSSRASQSAASCRRLSVVPRRERSDAPLPPRRASEASRALVQGSAALIQNGGGLNFAWASKLVNECERILNEPPPEPLPSPPAADAAATDGERPAATREALLGFLSEGGGDDGDDDDGGRGDG